MFYKDTYRETVLIPLLSKTCPFKLYSRVKTTTTTTVAEKLDEGVNSVDLMILKAIGSMNLNGCIT